MSGSKTKGTTGVREGRGGAYYYLLSIGGGGYIIWQLIYYSPIDEKWEQCLETRGNPISLGSLYPKIKVRVYWIHGHVKWLTQSTVKCQ